jgi:hypothetical protein
VSCTVLYISTVYRYIAAIRLQSYKATLPDRTSLISQGEMRISFTYEDALTGNKAHMEESWLIGGKLGKVSKDVGRMLPPIHTKFANWGSSPQEIERFTRLFGVLWDCDSNNYKPDYDFGLETSEWKKDQKRFRDWWRYRLGAKPPMTLSARGAELKRTEQEARQLQRAMRGLQPIEDVQQSFLDDLKKILEFDPLSPEAPVPSLAYSMDSKGIKVEIVAPDLWTYMILRLLTEKPAMLRVCQNKTCSNPYFVATRKDQKFCCSDCSQLVASRRWWASQGSDRRRKRNLSRRKKGRR